MMERVIVGDDVLRHNGVTFRAEIQSYDTVEVPNDYLCYLIDIKTGDSVRWLQGDPDLDYGYFREYLNQLDNLVRTKQEGAA